MNDNSLLKSKNIQVGTQFFSVPCFIFEDNVVWGATSMILNELKEVIKLSINQY